VQSGAAGDHRAGRRSGGLRSAHHERALHMGESVTAAKSRGITALRPELFPQSHRSRSAAAATKRRAQRPSEALTPDNYFSAHSRWQRPMRSRLPPRVVRSQCRERHGRRGGRGLRDTSKRARGQLGQRPHRKVQAQALRWPQRGTRSKWWAVKALIAATAVSAVARRLEPPHCNSIRGSGRGDD